MLADRRALAVFARGPASAVGALDGFVHVAVPVKQELDLGSRRFLAMGHRVDERFVTARSGVGVLQQRLEQDAIRCCVSR